MELAERELIHRLAHERMAVVDIEAIGLALAQIRLIRASIAEEAQGDSACAGNRFTGEVIGISSATGLAGY
jgi:hypothetical protein